MSRRIRFTLDDQALDRYQRVPFEVPADAGSVEVRIAVAGDAVIDLGCASPDGFRGWSGGARRSFVIAADDATPGYLPGVAPGEWAVILGLHALPEGFADVDVDVLVPAESPLPTPALAPVVGRPRGSTRDLPAADGLRWFAGDCHAHTHHSDGTASIDELAARGVASGLDFLCVTDHNTVSHHPHLPAPARRHGIALVPGQEVTTHLGHANAFGDIGWIDFRRPARDWAAEVAARGGLLSVNHPIDADCGWRHDLDEPTGALELWHISWFRDLTHTGAWAFQRRFAAPTLLGGSDWHTPSEPWTLGTPTTWVLAEAPTPDAVLAAMIAGRTAISVGVRADATPDPLGSPLLLRLGDDLVADRAEGLWLVDADDRRRPVTAARATFGAAPAAGPYRLEDPLRRVLAISR